MKLIMSFLSVMALVILDQWTKYEVVMNLKNKPDLDVIEGVFELTYLENRGASFGMLQDKVWLFVIFTTIVLVLMVIIYIRLPKNKRFTPLRVTMILLFAGAFGNFIDRIRIGYVVDMFHFYWFEFPVFNVADICVVIASALLIILMLFYYKDEDLDYKRLLGVDKNESSNHRSEK